MAVRCDLEGSASLVTAPTWEPVTIEDLRLHLGGLQDDDLPLVREYLSAARHSAELYLGRAIPSQTWKLSITGWAAVIPLPMAAPLQSITLVEYYNAAGSLVTLSSAVYSADTSTEPGRLLLAADEVWPDLHAGRRGPRVFVTYLCGYATVAAVPPAIKQGIRLAVAGFDGTRGTMPAGTVQRSAEALWSGVGIVRESLPCD